MWVAENVADSLCGLAPRFSPSYFLVLQVILVIEILVRDFLVV